MANLSSIIADLGFLKFSTVPSANFASFITNCAIKLLYFALNTFESLFGIPAGFVPKKASAPFSPLTSRTAVNQDSFVVSNLLICVYRFAI